MSELAIRTSGLRKVYRSGFLRSKHVGLVGLDLEVKRGEVFGFIGPNGAGKTTTLKLLMGLNFPTSGSGELLGSPLGDRAVRAQVGFLPERPYFYDYLTAEEFLDFYGQLHGMPKQRRREKIDELIPRVHMERARRVQLRKFSKGMLQRVGVAQALMNDPELVIFDEPTSGLDPMGRMLIRDITLELRDKGVTVFFSSHVLSDVEQICDRVGIMARGELQAVGTVPELVAERDHAVEVYVHGLDDATAKQLAELADNTLKTREGQRIFTAADSDAANVLARRVLELGGHIISIVPHRESLEQVFVDEMTAIERQAREAKVR